jgi:hypothetical protein
MLVIHCSFLKYIYLLTSLWSVMNNAKCKKITEVMNTPKNKNNSVNTFYICINTNTHTSNFTVLHNFTMSWHTWLFHHAAKRNMLTNTTLTWRRSSYGSLRRVVWQKFTDVSWVLLPPSSGRWPFYQTLRGNNPEDGHLPSRRRKNLKSHYINRPTARI